MPPSGLPSAAVADAGPLIHLDELSSLHLLAGFGAVLVPSVVVHEAERHRPGWLTRAPDCVRLEEPAPKDIEALRDDLEDVELDPGELAALALWYAHRECVLLCDDLAARRQAEILGCDIAGTLGLLLWAARVERITADEARTLLSAIPDRTTLHIRRYLIDHAISSLDQPQA